MRRYCSNAFTDAPKQDAMNLFLGAFLLLLYCLQRCLGTSPLRLVYRHPAVQRTASQHCDI